MGQLIRTEYPEIEKYMQECMSDSAHDVEHIYRVLNYARYIAEDEWPVNADILTAACLPHDIGRAEQIADPAVDHAVRRAAKACGWLLGHGYTESFASAVKRCIQTHRYRSRKPPESIEAKILFDADKIDVCGAVGIARTLVPRGLYECS